MNSKDDRIIPSPADRLLSAARSKKIQIRDSTITTTTPKLPPVKTKLDPSRYCNACHRKTGIATSYNCRYNNFLFVGRVEIVF